LKIGLEVPTASGKLLTKFDGRVGRGKGGERGVTIK